MSAANLGKHRYSLLVKDNKPRTVMLWDKKDYPNSLKNFTAPVRNKAIEIANALLADGSDEQRAIAIATARAEAWATNRNMKIRKDNAPTPT